AAHAGHSAAARDRLLSQTPGICAAFQPVTQLAGVVSDDLVMRGHQVFHFIAILLVALGGFRTHVRYATQQHKSTAKIELNVRRREEHFGKGFKAVNLTTERIDQRLARARTGPSTARNST